MAEAWVNKARRLKDYAREDFINGRFDSASFFAQQSVELLLKGILIRLTGSRPITHSTSELLTYLTKILNKDAPQDVIRCSELLEQHYVQARYPDARINEYKSWEAEEAIKCMEVVWSYVQQVVNNPQ
ncbi:HEPN domain-containing protein [Caldivirga maquilingensis]|uniref:HEPN domain protein n=1 Tax=Caldivirga maquilingensis (strain ATCC 700844 / DSM 13496 / JCM 10307 / IC-167) TaxID=397948 RepID=A8M8S8_CALMQ|nr:HEPN domain-containing protein [Caldivirga maquilingensis]ABW02147.1 HEPN domain protein [Caldivirga maquilingensis IC-167]